MKMGKSDMLKLFQELGEGRKIRIMESRIFNYGIL
jgi:hypothetical protein